MPDLRAQFRTKPPGDRSAYVAFKAVDRKRRRLRIRPASEPWERVLYHYLLRIVEDGEAGTTLTLVFTFMVVTLRGSNLQAVADAIETENCEFVQEFDPNRWDRPQNPEAPVIESIRIHGQRLPEDAAIDIPGVR